MNRKFNCVLLIDDDETSNYINKYIINEAGFAENVKIVENGQKALDYLKSNNDSEYLRPNLIFLDMNMPVMNGWEFLEQYKKLEEELQSEMVVVMLTTSLNPDDKANAERNESINHFMNKPLTPEMLQELQNRLN
ncbi:MAG: response regulator [Bacteroidia bacterium]|nr:response regulator [Bacteroidia bacterium]